MEVFCIITTYNRLNTLKKCLNCIFNQTYPISQVVVIDNNSTDGTKNYLDNSAVDHPNLKPIHLKENLGGAGGFYEGIKYARDNSADFIWGMDDDGYAHPDALEKLMDFYFKRNESCCLWSNCNNDLFDGEFKEVKTWMFVGFFIPVAIVKQIGLPRKDFFIYYDDIEYAQRIINSSYKIYKIKSSVIEHNDNPTQLIKKVNLFGKTINVVMLPEQKWRLYYLVRNRIVLNCHDNKVKLAKMLIGPMLRHFLKLLIFSPQNLGVFIKAIKDGIQENMGIRMIP